MKWLLLLLTGGVVLGETLSWDYDPQIVRYNVWHARELGGPYTNLAVVATNEYKLPPLARGAHYIYVVGVATNYFTTSNGVLVTSVPRQRPYETPTSVRLMLYQPGVELTVVK